MGNVAFGLKRKKVEKAGRARDGARANTHRAEATERWELGERVRVGWRREHGRVLR